MTNRTPGKYRRVDDNHKEIVDGINAYPGAKAVSVAMVGNGFGDIVAGYEGANYLLEVKDGNKSPSQRKLTPDEVIFHESWPGQIAVVNNLEEALTIMGIEVKR